MTQLHKSIKNQPKESMVLSFSWLRTTNQREHNGTHSLSLSILMVIGIANLRFFFIYLLFSRRKLIGLWVWIIWANKLFGLTNSDCWYCCWCYAFEFIFIDDIWAFFMLLEFCFIAIILLTSSLHFFFNFLVESTYINFPNFL